VILLKYKNTSFIEKHFYGVIFKSGEVQEVPGYINDPMFIRVPDTTKIVNKPISKKTASPKTNSEDAVEANNKEGI